MKVAYFTAGAGGMYCGSCLRDNTIVAALRASGRDVTLLPLYTPIRTDETDVSESCVYFGGVNVYLQQRSRLFRMLPPVFDRWIDRPGFIRDMIRRAERTAMDPAQTGPLALAMLQGERGPLRREVRKLVAALQRLKPRIVHLPNALFLGVAEPIARALDASVVCTLTGEDLFVEQLPQPWRGRVTDAIRNAARHAHGFVAVSRYYAGYAGEQFNIRPDRTHIVPLGVLTDDVVHRPTPGIGADAPAFPPVIGYLARICPDKGLHVLCDAFIALRRRGRDARLAIAGYLPPADTAYWEAQRDKLTAAGLADAVDFRGELDRAGKLTFLQSLDVFSVPATYREAKGIYVLEALAHGVPAVQPRHGSFPELIEATGGGLLCAPNDPADLAATLERLLTDDALRTELGCDGRRAVLQSFTHRHMADNTWAAFEKIHASRR
jgi:glycosyltransferase involved in cell wall biosynthesis